MKNEQIRSLRTYSTILLLILSILFTGLVIYNNYTAFSMLRKRVYLNTQDTVDLYQMQLDEKLKRLETYLYTISMDNADIITLNSTDISNTKWHGAVYRLKKSFNNALPVYTTDCLFCYLPKSDSFISAGNQSMGVIPLIRDKIFADPEQAHSAFQSWAVFEAESCYYLLRVIRANNAYIGSWISIDTLIASVAGSNNPELQLFLVLPDGKAFRDKNGYLSLKLSEEKNVMYSVDNVAGEKMLITFMPMKNNPFYLARLMPYSEVSDNNRSLIRVIIIVSVSFIFIWVLLAVFLKFWVQKPISALTEAIEQLQAGNLEVYVPASNQPVEFKKMTSAFNRMVSEIKYLKIDVYEKRLQNQRLETQYLKQQITPHFMINCLNTAYQLTESNRSELARKMLLDLSNHLRYTLSSGHTVALSEELKLVENYIELSGIRYPRSIALSLHCPQELCQATVVPLLLINFVENSIKHEAAMGKLLEIHIEAAAINKEQDIWLYICIWDSGRGYSDDMLEQLQKVEDMLVEDTGHIGIVNVIQRTRHVFDRSEFLFSNRAGAGAQIDIQIPYLTYRNRLLREEGTNESLDC